MKIQHSLKYGQKRTRMFVCVCAPIALSFAIFEECTTLCKPQRNPISNKRKKENKMSKIDADGSTKKKTNERKNERKISRWNINFPRAFLCSFRIKESTLALFSCHPYFSSSKLNAQPYNKYILRNSEKFR